MLGKFSISIRTTNFEKRFLNKKMKSVTNFDKFVPLLLIIIVVLSVK